MSRKREPVVESARQRALKSCDRCKRKKRACKRYDLNGEPKFDDSFPCQNCITSNSECSVSIPRKKRKFFQIRDTELNQLKSLNLIVKAMFPENDPNNLDHLKKIADSLYISLPELEEEKESTSKVADGVVSGINNESPNMIDESGVSRYDISKSNDPNLLNSKLGLVGSHRIFNLLLEMGENELNATNIQNNTNPAFNLTMKTTACEHLQKSIILTKIPIHECNMYMQVYFKQLHQSYFIFHEEVFKVRYAEFTNYLARNDLASISDNFTNEEICSIYLVWILGRCCHLRNVLLSDKPENAVKIVNEPIINEYVNVVKISLSNCFFSTSLHSIRVLYLMALYCLIQMNTQTAWYFWVNCCLKCFGLGFNKKSMITKYTKIEQEEIKIIWWSSFKMHLNNCATNGRLPVISLSDVDMDMPKLEFKTPRFREAYFQSIKIFKIMFLILKNREELLKTKQPWTNENMINILKIIGQLKTWKVDLRSTLGDYSLPDGRIIIKLHMQYYYSSISLITPYLVSYSLQDVTTKENIKTITTILSYGIESAVKAIDVILYSVSSGNFNGVLHYDLFFAYNSLMILLLYCSIIKTTKGGKNPLETTVETELNLDQRKIMNSIYQIRNINRYHGHCNVGSNKFRTNINILLDYFNLNDDKSNNNDEINVNVPLINVAKITQSPEEFAVKESGDFLKDKVFDFPNLPSPMLGAVYPGQELINVDKGFESFIKFISKENENQNKRFNDQVILEWNNNIDNI